MPFAFEVEHTTGVTSGLDRMLSFHERAPHLATHFVVVAPDEDRKLVMDKSNHEQYQEISPWYLPYSAVEELYAFSRKRRGMIRGVDKRFLFNFMEPCFSESGTWTFNEGGMGNLLCVAESRPQYNM